MAKPFHPFRFFQRVPKHLLGRYFHQKHQVLLDIAIEKLPETRDSAEVIFQAFLLLPEDKHQVIEAELQDIDSMAFQGGIKALIVEATEHPHFNHYFPEAINQHESDHGKAMWAFLEYPHYWAGASSLLFAENIAESSWNKLKNLPNIPPLVEPEDAQCLENKGYRQTSLKQ